MLKKNFISTNLSSKNNLYLSNIIISYIAKNKRIVALIFSKNNVYFFNLKSKLC
ncbi:MAG: hypothetical protein CM15mP118_4520 [Alphaproteobacteria bacterium]|nr:MAG: hypothetical protein CM15mP118_4520 [Alphaproteobacteria bacterium]